MTYEINVPDTPQQAVEMHFQETFDNTARALAKLEKDMAEISENMDKGLDPVYVLGILRLCISLTELQLVNLDGNDLLRPDQRKRIEEVMAKHGRRV